MKVEQWLGEENKLGIDIWNNKYRFQNESFDEWLERVSNANEELKQLIIEKKYLHGGRTLTNYNTYNGSSVSNCYSSGYAPDNLEGLLELNKNIGLTYKAQGGQGISLSKIRPKGSPLSKGYTTDGIIPFMEIFNTTTASVSQGGSRKGALIMSIDAWHKESDAFIRIKSEEGKIEKANLSLEFDDEFMGIVEKDRNCGTETSVERTFKYESGVITYEIIPIRLFKLLAEKGYDWAEPGAIFVNLFRNYNLMQYCDDYQIETCNPCLRGDMKLLTIDGYKEIKDLDGKEVCIINKDGDISQSKVWCSGEKEIYKIKLYNKKEIFTTADHRFMTIEGEEFEAQHLKGKRLMPFIKENLNEKNKLFELFGFIQGDGDLGRLKSTAHMGLEVNIGKNDKDISDYFELKVDKRKCYLQGYNDILKELGFSGETLPNRIMPTTFKNWSYEDKISFLRGMYSANGSVLSCGRITYKTTCKELSKQLKNILNEIGISSYITTNKKHNVEFSNGIYECKESYDVNIQRWDSKVKFYNIIGFIHRYKMEKLKQNILNNSPLVVSVSTTNTYEKVYDFTEPLTHWGVVEGFILHNCGEQPLPKDGACNLGSLNLSEFVKEQYTDKSYFDYEDFKKAIKIAVKGLDEVLDYGLPYHALESQREMAKNYRNLGLGVMGLGSAMLKLGIKYGSQESIKFVDELCNFLFRESVIASSDLANELGSFPKYSEKVWISDIIKYHFTEEEIEILKSQGLRNCSLLSVAPSGSIGTMLNVTTGVEPVFRISYKRKTESLHKDKEVYYDVFIREAQEYMDMYGVEELPSHFIGSDMINYKDRVRLQGVMQKHIDTAISSTVNLPNEATVDDIMDLYILAWKEGLKGVTIYRDGCKRGGILTTDNEPKEETTAELQRGEWKPLAEDTVYIKKPLKIGCGKLKLFIGYSPSENCIQDLYIKKAGNGGCVHNIEAVAVGLSAVYRLGGSTKNIEKAFSGLGGCNSFLQGKLIGKELSKGSSCATAILNILKDFEKELNLKPIISSNLDELSKAEDRLVEGIKKQNQEMKDEMEQYKRINGETAFAKKYMVCPLCNDEIHFEGGCLSCPSCGWSKCE